MWFRVDDKFPDHPKAQQLSAAAIAVWVCAGCYCGEYETDGRIPKSVAYRMAARFDPQAALFGDTEPLCITQLCAAPDGFRYGLWTRTPDGYLIHQFLERNPSRRDLERERKRKRRYRQGQSGGVRNAGRTRVPAVRTERGRSGDGALDGLRTFRGRIRSRPDPVVRRSSTSPAVRFEGQGFQVLPERLEYWQGVYAAADVAAELRAAHAWLLANPTRRPRNPERFLVGWLKRAQDQAATRPRRETFEERQQRYLKVLQGGSA